MPFYIDWLTRRQFGQYIREDGPAAHHQKAGTPTAGGVLIVGGILLGMLLWLWLSAWLLPAVTTRLLVLTAVTLLFGLLGFSDDWLKISKHHNKGLGSYSKLVAQATIGIALGGYLLSAQPGIDRIHVFGWQSPALGWVYPVYAALVLMGASNAVNLTDGLDGLAAGTSMVTLLGLACLLGISVPELSIFAAMAAGAVSGFGYYNRHPARIFMGDTGSLALGGLMGAMALMGRQEWSLFWLAPVFVAETLSVIFQVASFKTTGKRLFKMAPLHHHFELCGLSETQIVPLFVGAQLLSVLLGFLAISR